MPKRSLIEEVNAAVEQIVRGKRAGAKLDADVASLARIAAELRELPRENFKVSLKENLQRSAIMPTATETTPAVRTFAAPRIAFKNVVKALEFYRDAFGAKETFRFETEGGIGHAEMMIGDSVIMFAEEWPEGDRYSAETWGHSPISMNIEVPDVDAFVEHAVAAGAKLVRPPADQFYGYRDAILLDPFFYTWNIRTLKEEMSLEEMQQRLRAIMPPKRATGVSPIPRGYRTVTPYMVARYGEQLINFVKQTFDAEEIFRGTGGAGGIHCEVRLGDSMLMLGGGIPGREFKSTPNTTALHVYVEDADATYEKALAAGGASISKMQDQEYGERSGSVKDPAGNFWYIATSKGPSYRPKGLNDVNVYMHPLRAEPVIMFLKRAFGATELAKYASPDGVIHHAEVQVGSSVVEMGEAHGTYEPMKGMLYVYVPDCDAVYQRALKAGATSLSEPKDHPYGDRSGGVTDPFGNQWYIATHVKGV